MGYHIEYDARITKPDLIDYFENKNDLDIVELIKGSEINNIYCRKSNKDSLFPYVIINKWIVAELDTDYFFNNNNLNCEKVNDFDDFSLLSQQKALSELIKNKELIWCKPALNNNNDWYTTDSYFDDLCVKSAVSIYFAVNKNVNKVYLILYQVKE